MVREWPRNGPFRSLEALVSGCLYAYLSAFMLLGSFRLLYHQSCVDEVICLDLSWVEMFQNKSPAVAAVLADNRR